ncbi:MAG: SMC-Scp complex subunit ScpB [Halorhodospira sp.]
MSTRPLRYILEAALLAAGEPLSLERIQRLFDPEQAPGREQIRHALAELAAEYEPRGIEICEVGGGYRIQICAEMAPWVSRLWEEKPQRYSRAVLETLALIAYRQPITRGEIEQVRGVSVSTAIIRTLEERGWIRVVGRREVPGRPALYATTPAFLEHFSLRSLDELPDLATLQDPEQAHQELEPHLPAPQAAAGEGFPVAGENAAGTPSGEEQTHEQRLTGNEPEPTGTQGHEQGERRGEQ